MIYLLYGKEEFLINNEIKSITLKNNINSINISHYDLNSDNLKDIIEDAKTYSLFGDKKLIIISNSYIFTRTNIQTDLDSDSLKDYINNYNPSTYLIFTVLNEKIDNVKKIVKLVKEKGVIKEFNAPNIFNIISNMFKDYQIDNKTINLLISRVGKDLNVLSNEVEKLKVYKINEKLITNEDIYSLTYKSIDVDIFKFIDNIINKNKKEAITTYKELLKINEEPIKILSMLANKFRLMFQACNLNKQGYSEQEISDILKVHKYPVSLAINSGLKYSNELLLSCLNKLAQIDIDIKTGNINKYLAIELFLIEL